MLKKIILKDNLIFNVNYLKQKASLKTKTSVKFCAVVKANAYGHGMKEVAMLIHDIVNYFAVSNYIEAENLAKLNLKPSIIILTPININEAMQCLKYKNVEFTVESIEDIMLYLKLSEKTKKEIFLHIKVNSGMNRFGESETDKLKAMINFINCSKFLKLKGLFTHYFMSENDEELLRQDEKFFSILKKLNLNKNVIVHASNTDAILSENKNVSYDMVRSGIGLYGYADKNLKPVMKIEAEISKIYTIKQGENLGYSKGFIAKKNTTVALVKIGYADGLNRHFKNKSVMLINGQPVKIVGNICMDCCFLDITNLNAKINDKVIIINENNTAQSQAEKLKTISYELLCGYNNLRGKTFIE